MYFFSLDELFGPLLYIYTKGMFFLPPLMYKTDWACSSTYIFALEEEEKEEESSHGWKRMEQPEEQPPHRTTRPAAGYSSVCVSISGRLYSMSCWCATINGSVGKVWPTVLPPSSSSSVPSIDTEKKRILFFLLPVRALPNNIFSFSPPSLYLHNTANDNAHCRLHTHTHTRWEITSVWHTAESRRIVTPVVIV